MSSHSPEPPNLRRPHPLALLLIERAAAGMRVLELGSGSGRNTDALRAAGLHVTAVGDEALRTPLGLAAAAFDAAISTHGMLHGTPRDVAALVAETANALRGGAPAYLTFASTRDARFGQGRKIDERTYAPAEGDEAGVPHVFYDRGTLRAMLEPAFTIEALDEVDADAIVGRWAHATMPRGTVHWFALLRKPEDQ